MLKDKPLKEAMARFNARSRIGTSDSDMQILSLNVCGVKNKLNYDKFVNLINKHDIVRLTESKTDDIDKTQKFNTWICHVYEKQEETYENPLQWHYASSQR